MNLGNSRVRPQDFRPIFSSSLCCPHPHFTLSEHRPPSLLYVCLAVYGGLERTELADP
jgi:hypothetical protein